MPETKPVNDADGHTAPLLTVSEHYEASDGSVYAHKDLVRVVEPWAVESHIGPIRSHEKFGDVESWAEYVKAYTTEDDSDVLLTWSESGLRAVLDYHNNDRTAGRAQWIAEHRFVFSPQWIAWSTLANNQARPQKQIIESLEDLAEDIVSPDPAALLNILRTLRSTASATGATTLNPDGSTSVEWRKEASVTGKAEIPPFFEIHIPVLKGHYRNGDQVLYPIPIRMRPTVDDGAHVLFRLSIPVTERLLEKVYADRVQAAREALGSGYALLRAG